jgi:hypothetical protein
MADLLMRGRIPRILAAGLWPLLQRLSVADSSAHASPYRPREPARVRPQQRRHDLDPGERWEPSDETGFTSIQAGRGPPCRSSAHVVLDSSFAPLINNRNWRVTP